MSKVKRRVAKKVERSVMAEKICELQMRIDEYDRYLGDLLIMICKGEPQCVVEHSCYERADWIWDEVLKLIKENRELKEKLAQYSQGSE